MDSKIIRTVHGHPADPDSTRDLSRITAEELDHIRTSCEAGRFEAESYLAMDDDELKAILESNAAIIRQVGMGDELLHIEVNAEMRDFLRARCRASNTMLSKISASQNGEIKGITPSVYEHLVISLQAGYREAEVCCTATNESIAEAMERAIERAERLGLDFENPYSDFAADYSEFFQERAEILWDVLRCVNQPYSEMDGVAWEMLCMTE